MKLQLGCIYQHERRPQKADVEHLLGEYAMADTDIRGETIAGPLIMAYRGDRITSEEEDEVQPLHYHSSQMTFDGRLDNRHELATRAALKNPLHTPDLLLIAQAHLRCGDDIFRHILGEFSLVLWNEEDHSLRLVRSACGARPLYYVLEHDRLVWSSDFAHLVRVSDVDVAIDDVYILEYLISNPSPNRSPLINVHPVPPNRVLVFRDGQLLESGELWDPCSVKPIRYRSDQDYEEQFRQELSNAVLARLRTNRPVFSELSGGLDSSSLVLTADQLRREQQTSHPGVLETVSCVYEQTAACDESYFVGLVEQHRGIRTTRVSEIEQNITLGLSTISFTGIPNPLHCHSGCYPRFASIMKNKEARVLLGGQGGDHLFISNADGTPVLADYLSAGELSHFHQQCKNWGLCTGDRYFSLSFNAASLIFRSKFHKPIPTASMPSWLSKDYLERWKNEINAAPVVTTRDRLPSFSIRLEAVRSLFSQIASTYHAEYRDIYVTFPFTHRPLVEFCLGIPTEQFLRDGQTRSIMRRALHQLFPDKIIRRQSKGSLDGALARALRREWQTIGGLRQWQLCRRGVVHPERLFNALDAMRRCRPGSSDLVRIFSLERWLRSLSKARQSPTISLQAAT